MKRIIISLIIVGGMIFSAAAQKKSSPLAGLGSMTFYGIDFSKGRVYGSTDEPEKLRKAFGDIHLGEKLFKRARDLRLCVCRAIRRG